MKYNLKWVFHRSSYSDEGYDYGLDEDEGQPTDQTELSPAEDVLSNQAQALSLEDFSVTHGPGEAIIITSNAIATDPNIRYSINVPFLHYSGEITASKPSHGHLLPQWYHIFRRAKQSIWSFTSPQMYHLAQSSSSTERYFVSDRKCRWARCTTFPLVEPAFIHAREASIYQSGSSKKGNHIKFLPLF